jgi:hypothetical protein
MDFPDTLYQVDPDWCQCQLIYLPEKQIHECVKSLNEVFDDPVSVGDCTEFQFKELSPDYDNAAIYVDPSGYFDPVALEPDPHDPGAFRQAD